MFLKKQEIKTQFEIQINFSKHHKVYVITLYGKLKNNLKNNKCNVKDISFLLVKQLELIL